MTQNSTGAGPREARMTPPAPAVPALDGSRLTIRADAGPRIGTGHVMRCLALAAGWHRAGGRCSLVSRDLPEGLRRRAADAGVGVVQAPETEADASWARDADLVVVDGWQFGTDDLDSVARCAATLLVVDDTATRPRIPGDFVLNPNVYAAPADYAGMTGARLLVGPRYAPLRPEFMRALPARAAAPVAGRLLLLLGGADPAGASALALEAARIARGREPGISAVRLVVGAANPALGRLRAEAARSPGFEVLYDVQDMVTLMDWADLAISASGSTVLELASRGTPMLLGALIPEELPPARRLAELGAAQALGAFADLGAGALAAAILDLARDPARRDAMTSAGRGLVDGRGADRILAAVGPLVLQRRRPAAGGGR